MRAKTVKSVKTHFLCRRGLHALLRWRPYLVNISSDFKTDFFCIRTLCVFVVYDRWNSYFVVLIGMGR